MTPERRERLETVLRLRQPDLTVVLENVFDPHNISAVMRTCDSVGVQEIFILNTRIPRHKRWGFRSSSGAAKWLTVHQFENTKSCLQAVRQRYSTVLSTHLATDALPLYQVDFTGSIALVFGNEQHGVSEEVRALSDRNFIIPQVGVIRSLNISVACAVTLYEAMRQKEIAGHYKRKDSHVEMKQALMEQWNLHDASE